MTLKYLVMAGLAASGLSLAGGSALAQENAFLGQLSLTAGSYCPRGTTEANGPILPVSGNEDLFDLIGCTYGGDCDTTFGLPDLRGRSPIGAMSSLALGTSAGRESVTMTIDEMPTHSHALYASNTPATEPDPAGNDLGEFINGSIPGYSDEEPDQAVPMASDILAPAGGNNPFNIRQPGLVLRYCVVTSGPVPSES